MKINSIRIKIISLIFIAILIMVTAALFITVNSQRENLITATKRTLATNTEILNRVIRNIMLNGEAPIAVNTMTSLAEIQEFKEIVIYRVDGSNAFNDYKTVEFVNSFQHEVLFSKTPRTDRKIFANPNFRKVLDTNTPNEYLDIGNQKTIEYFFPILNMPECRKCHGITPYIRGIAHFQISIEDTINQINRATLVLTVFFVVIALIFGIILVFFMRNLIIRPLILIGNTVGKFGQGNLEVHVDLKNKDELGDLAAQINTMIKGLKERFNLTKYVSRSTDDLVKQGGDAAAQGGKKRIIVLFSDIRGFTSYSETQEPETVIANLNRILEVQAEIVERFGGDIDKFVGDSLMAIFPDELTAVRCGHELIRAVYAVNTKQGSGLLIGVGINSGEVIAGTIGSINRQEYAVIGATVNFASRLCGLAKRNMVLVSEEVYSKIKDIAETQMISNQKIKGKAETVNVYVVKSLKHREEN